MFPGFRNDTGRFYQNSDIKQPFLDFNRLMRFQTEALGAEPMECLDAVFGIQTVTAHIPIRPRHNWYTA
jgi:hypothetical protein